MPDLILSPDEVATITGKKRAAAQAAALAKRGIAYVFTGNRVRVDRAVALAYELLPQTTNRGVDLSKVR